MLCQLVCLDRRYSRMNCFNIREIQAIIKEKYFPGIVVTPSSRIILNNVILGSRFYTNNLDFIHPSMTLVHRLGLLNKRTNRLFVYVLTQPQVVAFYEFYDNNTLNSMLYENISNFYTFHFLHDLSIHCFGYYHSST
jgi:hypothetical protein